MVDVNTQNKTISVNVSSSGVSSNVNASGDYSYYYSEKAREWAISNRIVDGVDYSSKYYALNAQSYAQSAEGSYNNFQDSVTDSLSTIDNKVQEATDNIEIQKQNVITEIENLSEQEQNKIIDLGINTRANTDLDNLSEIGQKKFDDKADKSDVDGQWVSKGLNIGDNINVNDANNTGLTYSLAEYLPDDEYDYEVMFRYAIETDTTSGHYVQLDLFAPDYTLPATVSRAITRTSATNQISGVCIFPIGTSRNIVLQRNKYWNGKVNLGCCAYRRLGKNI